jgi:carboxyl-terminal processing protease
MIFFKKTAVLFTLAISFNSYAVTSDQPDLLKPGYEHSKTTAEIVNRLRHQHFQRTSIFLNDNLSSTVLDRYLEELDRDRSYFIAADIREFETYRFRLDDALKTSNLSPAFNIFNRYQQRITERLDFMLSQLNKGVSKLDFTGNDSLTIDRKDMPWSKSTQELDKLWHKRLKNDVLNLKLSGKKTEKIQELLVKRYTNQLKRIKQSKSEDAYRVYMNALTLSYDPHTQYFSPRATENFNIRMKLSLEGIGAMLQLEDDYTKVTKVIVAGPADKAGELKANDKIIGVGQGKEGEVIDVIGWRLDDVVDLIRGPKNTTVKLEILPASSADTHASKTISIIRDTVKLEEQAASKKIIELNSYGKNYKLGVIEIPKFYIDFDAASRGDPNYRSTTRDTNRLLKELMQEKVDAVIIDLRNNGGGSLREVDELVGLFIKEGPTVQVKNVSGRVFIHQDENDYIAYDGPLAVLVNRLSASASEIFAGAIQDYHRGIVVGTQTYGKGTVQAMMPLNHGQITLTQQKFYRISGNSTQNRGVIPDIDLPSLYDINEIGESSLDGALPWDHIRPAHYQTFDDFSSIIPQLQLLHEKRSRKDPDYRFLVKTNKLIEEKREIKQIALNEAKRKAETESLKNTQLELENERRLAKNMEPLKNVDELNNGDEDSEDKTDKPTPLLTETGYILVDYLNLKHPKIVKK